MEHTNYVLGMLTQLGVCSNILPYLGTITECASILRRTCKATNEFWHKYKECISWVILKEVVYKRCLSSKLWSVTKKDVKIFLKNDTYLLYRVTIRLKSIDSYKAINKFLNSV